MSWTLYGLVDPRDGTVRYIGYSKQPLVRFECHLTDRGDTYKCNWIRKLKSLGLKPQLKIISTVDTLQRAKVLEVKLIAAQRQVIGSRLTNTTIGGDGAVPIRRHTPLMNKYLKSLYRNKLLRTPPTVMLSDGRPATQK